MRVSTANRYETAVDSLQQRQRDMAEAQTAMTNGKRINKPSDDPTAAARAERAYLTGERIASAQRSVDASRNAMTLAEAALGQAGELMQTARETLVNAGNGSYSPAERTAQANQLASLRGQLLVLANQANGAGGYLFGGQGGTTIPFLDTPDGVVVSGAAGQSLLSSTEQMPSTVDGQAIWLSARSGNGVFTTGASATNTGTGWIDAGTVSDPAALTGGTYTVDVVDNAGVLSISVLNNGQPTAIDNQPFRTGQAISVDGMTLHIKGTPVAGEIGRASCRERVYLCV